MKIGDLVKQHGVSVDTIRFYEKQQLLTPSAGSEGGYRLYSAADGGKAWPLFYGQKVSALACSKFANCYRLKITKASGNAAM
ncbi:MerR family DNA-binding transcriptional regulator [Alishewanella longhuensis]